MKYLLLNAKTWYELLGSLIKTEDLISYALNNNMKAIGITDSNMFNCIEFYNLCKKNNIKPIIGIQIECENMNFLLYAKNYNGYINLCKIVSKKNIQGINLEFLKKYSKNLKCVCTLSNYENLNQIFTETFVNFKDEEELEKIKKYTNNFVFAPLIRYLSKEDKEYYKYIKLIKLGKTINDNIFIEDEFIPETNNAEIIKSTYNFIEDIDIQFPEIKLKIPIYNENPNEFFKALCKKGLEKRLNGKITNKYIERLKYEISIIENMNFVNYFLIVYDFVLYAKKNAILVGPGRGSAAGSLVSYCLGITDIDPLKYNLIFERFLNPERITMPDIDIDFDNMKKDKVIEYVKNKYGILNVANIITFNTLLPKQVIRDVARVMNITDSRIDKLCQTIKNEKTIEELQNNNFKTLIKNNNDLSYLIKICKRICGFKRNTSIHAAGVVICDEELSNLMPLYYNDNNVLTAFTMDHIEDLGLLKMDFLSIRNLNTISNIINDVYQNTNKKINLNDIPLNDEITLKIFREADTTGIFQFESSGMKQFLKTLKPDNLNTLIDAIALYRPGPRDMIPEYIAQKNGKKKINYLIKELIPILSSTYGVMIYQEQVLEILRTIGGYTYAQADVIRRAMSKKKADIIEREKETFINGVIKKGYNSLVGEELYNKIIKFSNYGFNKSHSVVYSIVAFQMAYLKAHYSKYFMKSLLNMSIQSEVKIKEYIDESKKFNIEFEKVNINKSYDKFIINNEKIVLPFSIIHNIGETVSKEILNEREKSNFKSFYDFLIRTYGKSINKRIVISLIECGAFDEFKLNKKEAIYNLDIILDYITLCKDLEASLVPLPIIQKLDDFDDNELMDNEIKNYGFYLSHHPVTKFNRSKYITTENIQEYFNKTIHTMLLIENIKTITTKNNEKMSFITLSDEYSKIEGIVFPNIYSKFLNLEKGSIYIFDAKVEKRANQYQLIIYNILKQ